MDKFAEPMLAAKPDAAKKTSKGFVNEYTLITYPKLGSYKYDGVRAEVRGGQVWSRSGKLIPNLRVQRLFGRKAYEGFDGELIVGDPTEPGCFNRTQSGVMTVEGEPDVYFYALDFLRGNVKGYAFKRRIEELERHYNREKDLYIKLVEYDLIESEMELQMIEEQAVGHGYEGYMLRDPAGAHKHGRSTMREQGLIAIKRFVQAEGRITGWKEEMANGNEAEANELGRSKRSSHKANKTGKGTLGSVEVEVIACSEEPEMVGRTNRVGTGFTAEQRLIFWKQKEGLLGQVITFKFQAHGTKDAARIPVFIGFRPEGA